ncbi:MAG: putative glycoside hydrolase/deacetylase ChbG (UPF0249 family) [Saprospiraceae bacterium]|jgi:predicted glycoside hydrolase/deacetylase ChbG (UPF0249 family)
MKNIQKLKQVMITLILTICFMSITKSQASLAEKLGYAPDDKLLIIHSDDLGVTHSENIASIHAMRVGMVNSGSIMMPCPWVPEIAAYAKMVPKADLGLHLTLTSEWKSMKWGPVAPLGEVTSLVGADGYLYKDCTEFAKHADPVEAKKELRAQIELAYELGIKPTHLDSHMGCLIFSSPEVFQAYLELGREFGIPVMVARFFMKVASPAFKELVTPSDVLIETIYTASPTDYAKGMPQYYTKVLSNLNAGIQILLIHTAYDDAEMQALSIDHPEWGASWRQADFDFFTSEECREIIERENIKLVTWREIQGAIYPK